MLESQPQTRAGCAARAGPSITCVVQRTRNMHNKLSLDSQQARARALSRRRARWRMRALKHAISHARETPWASSLWHVVLCRRSKRNWLRGGRINLPPLSATCTVPGEGARRGRLISDDHVGAPGWGCRCVRLTPTPRASLLGAQIIKSCGRAIAATHLTHVHCCRPCICAVGSHPRLKPARIGRILQVPPSECNAISPRRVVQVGLILSHSNTCPHLFFGRSLRSPYLPRTLANAPASHTNGQ
jgi:hypothetical protein